MSEIPPCPYCGTGLRLYTAESLPARFRGTQPAFSLLGVQAYACRHDTGSAEAAATTLAQVIAQTRKSEPNA